MIRKFMNCPESGPHHSYDRSYTHILTKIKKLAS